MNVKKVVLFCSLYIAMQIFSDVASLRIVMLVGLSIDAGTLVYPFTFTLRDAIHKSSDASMARMVIVLSALLNVFMAGLFFVVANMQPDSSIGLQSEFGLVLSPVWRIVIASILAELIANLVDTEAYSLWVKWFGHRHQYGRVLFSNAISIPLDSVIFITIAFYGVLPSEALGAIFASNVILKGVISLTLIPLLYTIKDQNNER